VTSRSLGARTSTRKMSRASRRSWRLPPSSVVWPPRRNPRTADEYALIAPRTPPGASATRAEVRTHPWTELNPRPLPLLAAAASPIHGCCSQQLQAQSTGAARSSYKPNPRVLLAAATRTAVGPGSWGVSSAAHEHVVGLLRQRRVIPPGEASSAAGFSLLSSWRNDALDFSPVPTAADSCTVGIAHWRWMK
jgi:hypothetical protein